VWFVALGCVFIVLKLNSLGPIGAWSWLWVLSPFGAAAVWWAIADATGYTKRREADRERQRVETRRRRHIDNLGMGVFDRKRRDGRTSRF